MAKNRIIKSLLFALTASIIGAVTYHFIWRVPWPATTSATTAERIISFDPARDTQAILDIFKQDRYWLVSSDDYSPEFALANRAPNQHDTRYYGTLEIKVLYDHDTLAGFTAYYMKNFCVGILLFIDVKPEFRGKGYAQELMTYAINDMKKRGASIISLVTRTSNEAAQKLYKKLGFMVSHEEDGYVYFELRP